jgi:type I restriction enzyme S subunit
VAGCLSCLEGGKWGLIACGGIAELRDKKSDRQKRNTLSKVLTERTDKPDIEAVILGEIPIVAKIGFDTGKIELREEGKTNTNMILIQPGDLILSGINAAKGAIAIYGEEKEGSAAATIHYSSYIVNKDRADILYLWYFMRSNFFRRILLNKLPGGIKTEIKPKRLLSIEIPLPPLEEQKRIAAKIENLVGSIEKVRQNKIQMEDELQEMLLGAFLSLTKKSQFLKMGEVAPIIRRPVEIDLTAEYPELGIRSFGKGTFHKPPLNGMDVGTKRLFSIEPGDLVFSNVFAWEGGVAVAKPEDIGRFGSHRFITCLPREGKVTASFLCFYFLTNEGLSKLGEASPGGAGRNRTLGLKALEKIMVPAPPLKDQLWFDSLQERVEGVRRRQEETQRELAELVPAILDRAFKGKL